MHLFFFFFRLARVFMRTIYSAHVITFFFFFFLEETCISGLIIFMHPDLRSAVVVSLDSRSPATRVPVLYQRLFSVNVPLIWR